MDLLQNMLTDDQTTRQEEFARRYDTGSPWDGISDDEAAERYAEIAPQVPRDVYESAARDSISRLDPQQRATLGRYLRDRAPEFGMRFPDVDGDGRDDRLQDPEYLARVTSDLNDERPGVLGQILGNKSGGAGLGSLITSPIGKAVLGGIAAFAFRQLTGRR
jgi:hypothetical protein